MALADQIFSGDAPVRRGKRPTAGTSVCCLRAGRSSFPDLQTSVAAAPLALTRCVRVAQAAYASLCAFVESDDAAQAELGVAARGVSQAQQQLVGGSGGMHLRSPRARAAACAAAASAPAPRKPLRCQAQGCVAWQLSNAYSRRARRVPACAYVPRRRTAGGGACMHRANTPRAWRRCG
jgi:hypothetical protein